MEIDEYYTNSSKKEFEEEDLNDYEADDGRATSKNTDKMDDDDIDNFVAEKNVKKKAVYTILEKYKVVLMVDDMGPNPDYSKLARQLKINKD